MAHWEQRVDTLAPSALAERREYHEALRKRLDLVPRDALSDTDRLNLQVLALAAASVPLACGSSS
jgi:hypothetical protein